MFKNNPQGFTLVEILIAISISILLFFVLGGTYSLTQKIYSATDSKAEITQNGRVILDRLTREIRQATDIITELPDTASSSTPGANEIMFQDGHDLSSINYIRYYTDGHSLERQEIYYYYAGDASSTHVYYFTHDKDGNDPIMVSSTPNTIGEYVDGIEFSGYKLINISLFLSKNKEQETLSTAVYGRNL